MINQHHGQSIIKQTELYLQLHALIRKKNLIMFLQKFVSNVGHAIQEFVIYFCN